jgi:hypothetical protein
MYYVTVAHNVMASAKATFASRGFLSVREWRTVDVDDGVPETVGSSCVNILRVSVGAGTIERQAVIGLQSSVARTSSAKRDRQDRIASPSSALASSGLMTSAPSRRMICTARSTSTALPEAGLPFSRK